MWTSAPKQRWEERGCSFNASLQDLGTRLHSVGRDTSP